MPFTPVRRAKLKFRSLSRGSWHGPPSAFLLAMSAMASPSPQLHLRVLPPDCNIINRRPHTTSTFTFTIRILAATLLSG